LGGGGDPLPPRAGGTGQGERLAGRDLSQVAEQNPEPGQQESERFRAFAYDELMQRDKVSLDIFWLKDESLEDTENLPAPDVLAAEIVENLQAALEQFESIYEALEEE